MIQTTQIQRRISETFVNRTQYFRSVRNQMIIVNLFLGTPHAKNAFFISFTSLTLSFLTGAFTIVGFATYIFKETGSSLSEKDSSILVSITLLTGNLIFLNIVERINRRVFSSMIFIAMELKLKQFAIFQTLYITSSVLTMAAYFLFSAYGYFWLKQPGYEWMPPFCFACIVYCSCMGLSPIPFILSFEIYPKKVHDNFLTFVDISFDDIFLVFN